VPDAGVPLRTSVELLKVTPLGNAPDSVIPGFGNPDAVTLNDPAVPTVKVVLAPLVIAGA
jgi:hypothetical protein